MSFSWHFSELALLIAAMQICHTARPGKGNYWFCFYRNRVSTKSWDRSKLRSDAENSLLLLIGCGFEVGVAPFNTQWWQWLIVKRILGIIFIFIHPIFCFSLYLLVHFLVNFKVFGPLILSSFRDRSGYQPLLKAIPVWATKQKSWKL